MVYPHTFRTEHSETKTTNSIYGEYYATMMSRKIRVQPELLKILQYVDSHPERFLDDLKECVKIKSITSELKYRKSVHTMRLHMEEWLNKLQMTYECFNIGNYHVEGKTVRLPPVILASIGKDPTKETICAYLHMDVPCPDMSQWKYDPWTLTTVEKKVYGNGVCCGKGIAMMWFHVIQAFQESKMELPVNVKFIIDFMYHDDSRGLAKFIATRTQDFFADIGSVVMCDSVWLGPKHPCIIYGCVGILHFELTVEKTENSTTDIKEDMEKIFQHIVGDEEQILIKGFNDLVEQITPDEEKAYEKIVDFDLEAIRDSLPPYKHNWDQVKLLISAWRLPSMVVTDTMECICDKKEFTKVKRLFTIKIVPRQSVDEITLLTKKHVQRTVKDLKIENKVNCELLAFKRPWFENLRLPPYSAARRATIQIYKEDPNMIREGIGREVVTVLDRVLEKNIVMIPMVCKGSDPGEPNENISLRNYFEGTKLIAAYLFQISYLQNQKNTKKTKD